MVDRAPQPADDSTKAQRRRHAWRVAGAGLPALGLLVVLLLACVLWIPRWLYPSLTRADLHDVSDAAKVQELKGARLKLQNDARTTLLQGLGALLVLTGAAVGAGVTLRQVRATRDQITETATASRSQLALSEQGQVTDRYTKAIDQLDAKKALAIRLGGLYALERIAHDSPRDRATIAEVLCAYARTAPRPKPLAHRAKSPNPSVADSALVWTPPAAGPSSLTVRAPDVQAAVSILGRWRRRLGEPAPVLDLHSADLQGAGFRNAQLQRAYLPYTHLQDADLDHAQLQHANLDGAQLQRAYLVDADLQGAYLNDADLRGANLYYAELQRAYLRGVKLQGAMLEGARLRGAFLAGADLRGVFLDDAELQGAFLTDAHLQDTNLDDAHLQGARASAATEWPEDWDHARARAVGVQFIDFSAPFALLASIAAKASIAFDEADVPAPNEPAPPDEE